jgi:hypothetical protein
MVQSIARLIGKYLSMELRGAGGMGYWDVGWIISRAHDTCLDDRAEREKRGPYQMI